MRKYTSTKYTDSKRLCADMFKRLEEIPLTNYASTRLTADEKMQLVHIATQCGKKPSVILREAFRFYLSQSVLISAKKNRRRMLTSQDVLL